MMIIAACFKRFQRLKGTHRRLNEIDRNTTAKEYQIRMEKNRQNKKLNYQNSCSASTTTTTCGQSINLTKKIKKTQKKLALNQIL